MIKALLGFNALTSLEDFALDGAPGLKVLDARDNRLRVVSPEVCETDRLPMTLGSVLGAGNAGSVGSS